MKSIGIVTDSNSEVAAFLENNLKLVFDKHVMINKHYLNELHEDYEIKDDVVLVMIEERARSVQKHVENTKGLIVVQRTIEESQIYKIFSIPEGTKVLVVNDKPETTLEIVSLLYQIGIRHLEFVAYEQGQEYTDIKIAITPGESKFVPSAIEKIIDIGNRCIDMSTFIKIMTCLDIKEKQVERQLIKYSDKIVNLDTGVKEQYKQLFIKNEELDTVINLSKEGIVLVNNKYEILLCNNAFKSIFEIKKHIIGENIAQVLDSELIASFKNKTMKDELVKFKEKHLILNTQTIEYLGEKTGCYYNVQEVTHIKQLEETLSRKLKDKGLVARYHFEDIKTQAVDMLECIGLAKKISKSDLTTLIIGESGTGKEMLAQSIHNGSNRSKYTFIAVNCAAVPENLLESQLFGYEGGSFTGALKEGKLGIFEQANNGTIFLDEIGDMPLSLQTRLLRVLQERQVTRIGSQRVTNINVRVIAATNRDLLSMSENGEFRKDLYYRLNVLPIEIPALRDRKEDIIPLLKHFIGNKKEISLSSGVERLLIEYRWPGNIRELQNVASYIELMCDKQVNLEQLPNYILSSKENFQSELNILESKCSLSKALDIMRIIDEQNKLNLGIGRKNLEDKLKSHGIIATEAEVRRVLETLRDIDLVSASIGRKGTEISFKGKNFLKWVKK